MKRHLKFLIQTSMILYITFSSYQSYSQSTFNSVSIGTTNIPSLPTKLLVDSGDINYIGSNTTRRIGFTTTDVIPNYDIANYGMSFYNNFPNGSGSLGPGVTLSGFYGLSYFTNNAERMRINLLGNIGIGTSDPQTKLQVENGDINSTGYTVQNLPQIPLRRIGFSTTDTVNNQANGIANYGLTFSPTFDTGSNSIPLGPGVITSGFYGLSYYTTNNERMRIDYRGYIGINTKTPTSMLQVNGDITAMGIKGPSDIRFKKNIKPLENSLNKISSINGYSYEWRKDEFPLQNFKKGTDIGLIAQEVEKIFPEIVYTDNNEMKSKSIDYTKLVPVLIESIKELKAELEILKELKAELEELKDLKAEVEAFKKEKNQIK